MLLKIGTIMQDSILFPIKDHSGVFGNANGRFVALFNFSPNRGTQLFCEKRNHRLANTLAPVPWRNGPREFVTVAVPISTRRTNGDSVQFGDEEQAVRIQEDSFEPGDMFGTGHDCRIVTRRAGVGVVSPFKKKVNVIHRSGAQRKGRIHHVVTVQEKVCAANRTVSS